MDTVSDKNYLWGCFDKGENEWESRAFNVKVGVRQGLSFQPLLFNIVLEALSREFREGLHMECLHADDLVLIAETKELLMKVRK